MKTAVLFIASALCISLSAAQTCSSNFDAGQVVDCFSTTFPSFTRSAGEVTHKFVSRKGSFRDIIRAPEGFYVESMAGGAFTSNQGQLTVGDLPNSRTFSGEPRQRVLVYNPNTLPSSSNCCNGRVFLYTSARICQSGGSPCFNVGVRRRRFDFPCTSPCAGTSGGTVVPFGGSQLCPACTGGGGSLPKCSDICTIDCSAPQSAVTTTMALECEDDDTGSARTCACPPFDATVETDNQNCVMDLVEPPAGVVDRVNFGVLQNVGFYRVTAPDAPPTLRDGYKIEFEQDVTNSTFCELEMSGALEIRRGFTNSFIGTTAAGRNLRIVDFAKLKDSVFGPMSFFNAFIEEGVEIIDCLFEEWNSRDNVNFKNVDDCGPPATCSTPIMGNTFLNITAVKNCAVKFTPDVSDNTFGVFEFTGTTRGCDNIGFGPM